MSWPEGVGGKGNEGVAAYVQRIKGSIGYVEYAYAKKNKMAHASVQNRDGQFVQPDDPTFQAAAAGADWKGTPGFGAILTDQPGKTSWPITGASFILLQSKQDKPQNAAETMKFFDWAFKNGQNDGIASSTTCRCRSRWCARSPTRGRRRSRTVPARPSGTDFEVGDADFEVIPRRVSEGPGVGNSPAADARSRPVHIEGVT